MEEAEGLEVRVGPGCELSLVPELGWARTEKVEAVQGGIYLKDTLDNGRAGVVKGESLHEG